MIARWRMAVVVVLALVNAAVSFLLLLHHHGRGSALVSQVCGAAETSGCATVAASAWSSVGGVPLAALGVAFSLSLALLFFLSMLSSPGTRNAAAALALFALGVVLAADVVLFFVQLLVVKAFCALCLATYALNAACFVLLLRTRRDRALVGEAWSGGESRVAFAGWVLGSLAVVSAVLATERALAFQEKSDAISALGGTPGGGPAPVPSATPLTPGTEAQRYVEEARAAQEQARRLQEILDDPQKLEAYMSQKAAREFDQGPVQAFDMKTAAYKGPDQAPIRVVEFSDFLCPFCRSIASAFAAYLPQSGNRVAVYFKNYPLDMDCNENLKNTVHPGACELAFGAVCAHDQGKFWPYHDRVFAEPPKDPQVKDVVALAAQAGLDAAAFQTCMTSPRPKAQVAADIAEARKGQVEATPTLFINGRRLPRLGDFTQTIDREAARLGLPQLPPPAHPGPGH